MSQLLLATDIFAGKNVFWIIGGIIAVVAILSGTITSVFKTRAREKTKREIAAYVAEGSIDPKDGVKMLNAGRTEDDED